MSSEDVELVKEGFEALERGDRLEDGRLARLEMFFNREQALGAARGDHRR